MSTGLAQQVQRTMARARALEQQRVAARLILARYGAVEGIARWATIVLRA